MSIFPLLFSNIPVLPINVGMGMKIQYSNTDDEISCKHDDCDIDVNKAIMELKRALDDANMDEKAFIDSNGESIIVHKNNGTFKLTTNAILPSALKKISKSMNDIFQSENRMNFELLTKELLKAFSVAKIEKIVVYVRYDNWN